MTVYLINMSETSCGKVSLLLVLLLFHSEYPQKSFCEPLIENFKNAINKTFKYPFIWKIIKIFKYGSRFTARKSDLHANQVYFELYSTTSPCHFCLPLHPYKPFYVYFQYYFLNIFKYLKSRILVDRQIKVHLNISPGVV